MTRPSKKEIKAALDKMKESSSASSDVPYVLPKMEAKKGNTKIRKKGSG